MSSAGMQESQVAIAFDCPVVSPKLKSSLEVNQYPDDLDFKVWGFYSATGQVNISNGQVETLYMNGAAFGCEGSVWGGIDKQYYWPKSGYLHFVAYAPKDAVVDASAVTDQGLQLTGYETDGNEDLLVSKVSYACTNPGAGVGAPLLFDHALSSIAFKVNSDIYGDRTEDDPDRVDTDLRITKISVLGASFRGNFSQQMSDWDNEQMTSPSAAVDPEKGWTPDYNSTMNYVAYSAQNASSTGVVLTDEFQFCHDMSVPDKYEETHSLTNLILLPQEISDDVVLEVTYDMTHSNMDGWITGRVKRVKLNECGVEEWLRGTRYCYYITLSLNKIKCSTEVVEWDSYETLENLEGATIKDLNEQDYTLYDVGTGSNPAAPLESVNPSESEIIHWSARN